MVTRRLFLGLLMLAIGSQSAMAHDHESFAMKVAKGSVGAAIGGGICYLLSNLCNGEIIATHENKMKFLEELKLYLESAEYVEQGANSRLFTHYYNGLNQLAQTTRGVEVSLLQDFAQSRDALSAKAVLARIEHLQAELQSAHENGMWMSRVIFTALGAIVGASVSFAGNGHHKSCGCSHEHHHHARPATYVERFARHVPAQKSIFEN